MGRGKKFRNGQWIKDAAEVATPETIKENTDKGGMGNNASEGINENTLGGLAPKVDPSMLTSGHDTTHLPPESDAAKYAQSRAYLGQNATPDGNEHSEVYDNQGNNYDFSDFSFGGNTTDNSVTPPDTVVPAPIVKETVPTTDASVVNTTTVPGSSEPEPAPTVGGNASEGINERTQGGLAPKPVTFDDLMGVFKNGNNDAAIPDAATVSGSSEPAPSPEEAPQLDDSAWENQEDQTWQNFLEWSKKRDEEEAKKRKKDAWWRLLTKGLLGAANIAGTVKGAPAMKLDFKDKEREDRAYQRLKDEKSQMMSLVQKRLEQMQKDKEYARKVRSDLNDNFNKTQELKRRYEQTMAQIEQMKNKDEREKKMTDAKIEYQNAMRELKEQEARIKADLASLQGQLLRARTSQSYASANKIRQSSPSSSKNVPQSKQKAETEILISQAEDITGMPIKEERKGKRNSTEIAIANLKKFKKDNKDKPEVVKKVDDVLNRYYKEMGSDYREQ